MKAIDLVRAMVYDSSLAENGGLVSWNRTFTLRGYFAAVSHEGEMECGEYFYVYAEQAGYVPRYAPDVTIKTEDAGDIWLWKLED